MILRKSGDQTVSPNFLVDLTLLNQFQVHRTSTRNCAAVVPHITAAAVAAAAAVAHYRQAMPGLWTMRCMRYMARERSYTEIGRGGVHIRAARSTISKLTSLPAAAQSWSPTCYYTLPGSLVLSAGADQLASTSFTVATKRRVPLRLLLHRLSTVAPLPLNRSPLTYFCAAAAALPVCAALSPPIHDTCNRRPQCTHRDTHKAAAESVTIFVGFFAVFLVHAFGQRNTHGKGKYSY